MSKLLRPKIHTSSSSTKIPRMIYTLLNQNTHTIPTSATPNTQLSPAPTQHPLKATKRIYYLFLNQNTHTHHIYDLSFRATKKNTRKILKVRGFIRAVSSRFGPPSGNQLLCWCPRGRGISLVRERWVPQRCGHPTAEHSERHTS